MSVKVPLAVWQWFRMEGIQRGTSLQDVCSGALVSYMEGYERMRDPALQGATFTDDGNTITAIPGAAFSPAARGEDVATSEDERGVEARHHADLIGSGAISHSLLEDPPADVDEMIAAADGGFRFIDRAPSTSSPPWAKAAAKKQAPKRSGQVEPRMKP